jgi:hypothetical protein
VPEPKKKRSLEIKKESGIGHVKERSDKTKEDRTVKSSTKDSEVGVSKSAWRRADVPLAARSAYMGERCRSTAVSQMVVAELHRF